MSENRLLFVMIWLTTMTYIPHPSTFHMTVDIPLVCGCLVILWLLFFGVPPGN